MGLVLFLFAKKIIFSNLEQLNPRGSEVKKKIVILNFSFFTFFDFLEKSRSLTRLGL